MMTLGALYGILAYRFFSSMFSTPAHGTNGIMLVSFLICIPIGVSAIATYLIKRVMNVSLAQALSVSSLPIVLLLFLAGTLLREGIICILLATPLLLLLGAIGAFLGWLSASFKGDRSPKVLTVFVLLPFAFGAVEERVTPPRQTYEIKQSVFISAPPASVWGHINFPTHIQPDELKNGFAYGIGVPYPIEGRTLQPGVGGLRQLRWQRGISFQEKITAWEENRYIAWDYLFAPDSFPENSLDDHIKIGGAYFSLESTSYTLYPEKNGTRLQVLVSFRVSTNFNWYAAPIAKFLIADTAATILQFYKQRAEHGEAAVPVGLSLK